MLETIFFYAIIICFALVLIAWSLYEFLHKSAFGMMMNLFYVLGCLLMLVRMIVYGVRDALLLEDNFWMILTFTMVLVALYMHFRLPSTMVAPISALIVLLFEGRFFGFMAVQDFWLPLVETMAQPWIVSAIVLVMIGLGLSLATLLLAGIYCTRSKEQPEEEYGTRALIYKSTQKMPGMLSHFNWWCTCFLSFGLGAYVLWSHTVYGVYWFWQPLFVLAVISWLIAFLFKYFQFSR